MVIVMVVMMICIMVVVIHIVGKEGIYIIFLTK